MEDKVITWAFSRSTPGVVANSVNVPMWDVTSVMRFNYKIKRFRVFAFVLDAAGVPTNLWGYLTLANQNQQSVFNPIDPGIVLAGTTTSYGVSADINFDNRQSPVMELENLNLFVGGGVALSANVIKENSGAFAVTDTIVVKIMMDLVPLDSFGKQ